MKEFELKILDFIQEKLTCPFLDAVMPIITSLANGGILWIISALVLICLKKTRKTGFSVGLALILGFIIGNLILKNAVARIRPYDMNSQIEILVNKLSDYSFPSGHTLASFEAASVLLIRNRRLGIPAIVLATLIAFSRLYLYVHYPTDVLAGAVLGIIIAVFASRLTGKLYSAYEFKKAINKKS